MSGSFLPLPLIPSPANRFAAGEGRQCDRCFQADARYDCGGPTAMDEHTLQSRLSRISTNWTVLAKAHQPTDQESQAARVDFIVRYQSAAYRYLLGAVRNPDTADDLFQEFALRFMRRDFQRASPEKGRFRDYLKTTLYHLVADYFASQRKRAAPLEGDLAETPAVPWGASARRGAVHRQLAQPSCSPAPGRRWPRNNAGRTALLRRAEVPHRTRQDEFRGDGAAIERATSARAGLHRKRDSQDAATSSRAFCRSSAG